MKSRYLLPALALIAEICIFSPKIFACNGIYFSLNNHSKITVSSYDQVTKTTQKQTLDSFYNRFNDYPFVSDGDVCFSNFTGGHLIKMDITTLEAGKDKAQEKTESITIKTKLHGPKYIKSNQGMLLSETEGIKTGIDNKWHNNIEIKIP